MSVNNKTSNNFMIEKPSKRKSNSSKPTKISNLPDYNDINLVSIDKFINHPVMSSVFCCFSQVEFDLANCCIFRNLMVSITFFRKISQMKDVDSIFPALPSYFNQVGSEYRINICLWKKNIEFPTTKCELGEFYMIRCFGYQIDPISTKLLGYFPLDLIYIQGKPAKFFRCDNQQIVFVSSNKASSINLVLDNVGFGCFPFHWIIINKCSFQRNDPVSHFVGSTQCKISAIDLFNHNGMCSRCNNQIDPQKLVFHSIEPSESIKNKLILLDIETIKGIFSSSI